MLDLDDLSGVWETDQVIHNPSMTLDTVFVVGAGASVPFGFPTGLQMKRSLSDPILPSDELRNVSRFYEAASEASRDPNAKGLWIWKELTNRRKKIGPQNMEVKSLSERRLRDIRALLSIFMDSGEASIDAFIGCQPNDHLRPWADPLDIGRIAVAAVIGRAQSKYLESLIDRKYDPSRATDGRNWIDWIFRNVRDGEGIEYGRVGFVTFNYDCVIEAELMRLFKGSYGSKFSNVRQRVSQAVPIVHVYGRLDPKLSLLVSERPFSDLPLLDKMSQEVRLIRNNQQRTGNQLDGGIDHQNLTMARNLIKKAKRLVFLGFGFDRINCHDILQLDLYKKAGFTRRGIERWERVPNTEGFFTALWHSKSYASTYGMENAERLEVINLVNTMGYAEERYIAEHFGESSQDCLTFLRAKIGQDFMRKQT